MPLSILKYLPTYLCLFIAFNSGAQYSKVHYLPPTYNQNSSIQFSTITVTTLVDDPFDVSITNASGTYSNILSGLSKTNPITITLPKGDNDGIFKGSEGKTNIVLNSEGFILNADEHFFTSQIHSVSNQAAVIAPKGSAGLGTEFYSGHMYSQGGNKGVRSHFISVIASEDNTTVTFDNQTINWEGQPKTFSAFLNRGESYVVAAPFDYIDALTVSDKFNAFNGTHVTSDKPIAMNSGSFLASYSNSGQQDAGVDQIVPVDQLNNEFILVKGQSTNDLIETAMIIASEDNTEVYVNGSSTSAYILNKGEYAFITGDNYENSTMHIKTSNPTMVYQNLSGSNSYATLGMVFVPGLMEDASRSVLISGANSIGSISIYIVAKKGEAVTINDVEIESMPIENPGNSEWVSYRIVPADINSLYCNSGNSCANKDADADFLIESTGPINAAISMVSGVVGAAGYFSGFASVNTDVGVSDFGTLEYTLPCIQDTVTLFAKGAHSYSWDSPSDNMNLITEINDSTYLFNYDQSGDEGPFTYKVIMESTSILGYVQNDTVTLTVNVDFTPECETNYIDSDSLFICLGDSIQINAENVNETQWYGEESFTLINDSTIEVKPSKTTTYYFSNFIKKENALINGGFEKPDLGVFSYQFVDASSVPGWNTTASDNKIEVWYDGFLGAPAYKGKQFIELNANMSSALYQDMPTTPKTKLMWGFAHRGRDAVDDMEFEVGPPGGPYEKIGTFSDGPTWKFYSGVYEVPEGQTITRFYYTSTQGGSYGNLLDAIEFFNVEEEKDSIVIIVNDLPEVYLGKDTTICLGDSFTATADSAKSYLWNTSDTTSNITIDSAGEYIVTVQNLNQCESKDTISINFISCKTNFLTNDTIEICQGDTVLIHGGNITNESWWSDHTFNLINDSLIEVFPINSPAVFYIGSSDIYADSIVVLVHENPNVQLMEDTTICNGDKITLTANASGKYTWSSNESSIEIEINQAGVYWLEIENAYGCSGNDSMELFIQDLPVVNLGNDTTICSGENIILDAENNELNPKWSTGDSTSQITVNYEGIFHVNVIDNIGCSDVDSIELFINELPVVKLGNDTSICRGQSFKLTTDYPNLKHSWNNEDTANSISVFTSGKYSVTVMDNTGCRSSDSIDVKINELPILNLGNDTFICSGESIELNAENINFNLIWNTGETNSKIAVSKEDTYHVQVTDTNGCSNFDTLKLLVHNVPAVNVGEDTSVCKGNSIELIAETSAQEYYWNTGDLTKKITVDTDGYYTIEVTDSMGCKGTDSIKLSFIELPSVNLGNDTLICEGKNITLNAFNPGATYIWNTRDRSHLITVFDAGTYSVTVSNEIGCTQNDSINIEIRDLPDVFLGNDTLICKNESLTLHADYGENYTISWSTGSDQNQITIDRKGLFVVDVIDDIGCAGRDEIYVSQEILPDPFYEKELNFCEGTGLELTPASGYEDYPIYWLQNKYSTTHTVFESGVYSGIIEGDYCIDTTEIYVTKIDTPDAVIIDANSKSHYCFEYESTQLNLLFEDKNEFTFIWDEFGETNNVEITQSGNYPVTVYNENCSSRYSYEIKDYCPGNLYVPNSFTPNNDGLNDVFIPVSYGTIDSYQFTIYNRWDHVVFFTNDIHEGWDGKLADKIQMNDVYVYKISYYYVSELGGLKRDEKIGTVTLLR